MTKSTDEIIAILETSIKVLEERYQLFNKMYEGAKGKTVTFLGAGFALLVYLYSNTTGEKNGLLDLLFIPEEIYGKLFYFISLYLILTSMYSLFMWGLVKLKRIFPQSFKDFLVHTFSVVPTEFRLLQV